MRTDDKRADSEYLASLRCTTRLDYNTSLHLGKISAYTHPGAVEIGKGRTAQSTAARRFSCYLWMRLSHTRQAGLAARPAPSWQRSMSVPPHVDPDGRYCRCHAETAEGPSNLVRLCKHAGFLGFFRLVAPFLELVWRFRAVSMLGFSNFYLACQRDNATGFGTSTHDSGSSLCRDTRLIFGIGCLDAGC